MHAWKIRIDELEEDSLLLRPSQPDSDDLLRPTFDTTNSQESDGLLRAVNAKLNQDGSPNKSGTPDR